MVDQNQFTIKQLLIFTAAIAVGLGIIIALPALAIELRLAILFLVGVCVATQLNRGIYRLAWFRRSIGPWSPPPEKALPRHWFDRVPILGWWTLRREAEIHGRAFWIRPMFIEIGTGVSFAFVYWWDWNLNLLPSNTMAAAAPAAFIFSQYLPHAVLLSLMIVATFIDFDEKTIPDAITVPGTLAGLVFAIWLPMSHLPIYDMRVFPADISNLLVTSPNPWLPELDGPKYLVVGMLCFAAWCYAILPKTTTLRRGFVKGVQFLFVSIFRHPGWKYVLLILLLGWPVIFATWFYGGVRWQALFTALVGMAFGGGIIWAVRIVGSHALAREAMGFGDVTLMAMIGAFVGWQPALIIFFLAPIAALIISLVQWLLTRRKDIAFGPYLCLGTVILYLGWPRIWDGWAAGVFALGWIIPAVMGVCLLLMGGLLTVWRIIDDWLYARAMSKEEASLISGLSVQEVDKPTEI